MPLHNIQNIILILSGKGGVGKSSITTQLALSLCLAGHSVGVLDVDLTGPSIPRFLGLEDAKVKQAPGGWLPVEVHRRQKLHVESGISPYGSTTEGNEASSEAAGLASTKEDAERRAAHGDQTQSDISIGPLHAISLGFLLPSRNSAVVWRGPKKTAMVRQFLSDVMWPDLDYLLIDTPPGTSDEHISLAETLLSQTTVKQTGNEAVPPPNNGSGTEEKKPNLAGALVVTTPQAISTSDVRKEINFCRKTGIPILGVLENMAGYMCECCGEVTNVFGKGGGQIMATEMDVRFMGEVPLDPGGWGALIEEGKRPKKVSVRREGVVTAGEPTLGNGTEEGRGSGDEGEDCGRDDGLLVDKYRDCMLYEVVMKRVAGELVKLIEDMS